MFQNRVPAAGTFSTLEKSFLIFSIEAISSCAVPYPSTRPLLSGDHRRHYDKLKCRFGLDSS